MGKRKNSWQNTQVVLRLFGEKVSSARKPYHVFVESGIALEKRPELTGGGLIRSSGGWKALKTLRRSGTHLKGDERILGDGDFVDSVLEGQNEQLERRYRLQVQGYDFGKVVDRVAHLFELRPEQILSPGKQPKRVTARSLVCHWATNDLGTNGAAVGKLLGIVQSSVSRALQRGEKLALENQYRLEESRKA